MRLTKPQELIYDSEKFIGGSIAVMCGIMTVEKVYPEEKLVAAIKEIYRTNYALNLKLKEIGSTPEMYYASPENREIEVVKVQNLSELDDIGNKTATTPFDMNGWLSELKAVIYPRGYGIIVKLHHLLGDAWSMSLIGTQFNEILEGKPSLRCSYLEYADAEDAYLAGKRYARDRAYFLDCFDRHPETALLTKADAEDYHAELTRLQMPESLRRELAAYAEKAGMTEFSLLFGLFALFYAKYVGCPERFYLGMPVLGRVSERELHTVGMYVNTAPVLIEPDYGAPLSENLERIADTLLSVFRHQKYNYGQLLRDLRQTRQFKGKLYDTMVNFQSDEIFADAAMHSTEYSRECQAEALQLIFNHRNGEAGLTLDYIRRTALLSKTEILRFHEALTHTARAFLQSPELPLGRLCLLPDAENFLRRQAGGPAADIPNESIYELFARQAERTPEKTAVIFKECEISYAQLLESVNDTADKLCGLGIEAGDVVAVRLERSELLFILQLAVLKCGAVFLPADKRFPPERLRRLYEDCGVRLLISDDTTKQDLPDAHIISPAELNATKTAGRHVLPSPGDVCYIIYTSGSTGQPKGCALRQTGLVNFCINNNTLPSLRRRQTNRFACVNSVAFDYFIAESLLPLLNGDTVVLLDEEESLRQDLFLSCVRRHRVNVLMTTPTRLSLFYDEAADCRALEQLDVICSSGEPLSQKLLQRLYAVSPRAAVFNPLGPSECTVWNLGGELDRNAGADVHLGKPIANTRVYILDPFLNPVPRGVTGELCISGAGVGAGYLGRPELTAEKFVDDPLGEGKLYRTGDLAFWREDGNIAYVGRRDTQLKLRGLRMEAGEIEAAMTAVSGIELAAVRIQTDAHGQALCAYYSGSEVSPRIIQDKLSVMLPKYMIPQVFVHLDAMPLTVSGKIDRMNLPQADLSALHAAIEYLPPETEAEKILCETAGRLLGMQNVGLLDHFFALGGDSIKAIHLASALQQAGFDVPVSDIMQSETMRDLAGKMDRLPVRTVYSQEEIQGACPFPPILRAYLNGHSPEAELFSHACILRTSGNEALLRQSLDALVRHHDMLRAAVDGDALLIRACDALPAYSFRVLRHPGDEGEIIEALKKETVRFSLQGGPLIDVIFCPLNRGGILRLTIHHYIVDLISWEILLADLFSILNGLQRQTPAALPEKTLSFPDWLRRLSAYGRNMNARELAVWEALDETLLPLSPFPAESSAQPAFCSFSLSREIFDRILQSAHLRTKARPQEMLLAALGLAVREYVGGDAAILNESHGRASLSDASSVERTVGWFTSCYPVVFKSDDPVETLLSTRDALRGIPNCGIGYLLLHDRLPDKTGVIFNYFNDGTRVSDDNALLEFISDNARFPGMIAVNCILTAGGLRVEILQAAGSACEGAAEMLAKIYETKLTGLCELPEDGAAADPVLSGFSDKDLTAAQLKELEDLFEGGGTNV